MSYYPPQPPYAGTNPSNLQFYQSSYGAPVSGHTTPSQAQYGGNSYNQASQGYSNFASPSQGFGAAPAFGAGVSGRMGEQGGLRTGWLAAFGTEGYDGEPPLLEELGVNFGHIKIKVWIVEIIKLSDLVYPMNSLSRGRNCRAFGDAMLTCSNSSNRHSPSYLPCLLSHHI